MMNKKSEISEKTLYTKDEIEKIFYRFSIQNPNPKSDLIYTNLYTLLIAVVLSARTSDKSVNKTTKTLFKIADTPEKMLHLGENKLSHYIHSIGLWRKKAKNIIALSKIILKKNNQIPHRYESLTSLPGVGRKTANVILNIAFHQPTIGVDTHIFRIANRIGFAPGKTFKEVENKLLQITPHRYLKSAHQWLVLHGRYLCKARQPKCTKCIILDICKARIND
ncbi:MAG: endonuclease III [Candidatus Tokpelaia sp. JSC161]|jgi:endonuclease-3|nr:MAG: endonuclease III [Candidatus Tokpelaia sp. JSC161]